MRLKIDDILNFHSNCSSISVPYGSLNYSSEHIHFVHFGTLLARRNSVENWKFPKKLQILETKNWIIANNWTFQGVHNIYRIWKKAVTLLWNSQCKYPEMWSNKVKVNYLKSVISQNKTEANSQGMCISRVNSLFVNHRKYEKKKIWKI